MRVGDKPQMSPHLKDRALSPIFLVVAGPMGIREADIGEGTNPERRVEE